MSDTRTQEASKKWGYTQTTISKWCKDGLISNATQDKPGSPWHIPENTKCPKPIKKTSKK